VQGASLLLKYGSNFYSCYLSGVHVILYKYIVWHLWDFLYFRPMKSGSNTTGRGVMSMTGLSYGVVRVEEPGNLTSLTLQDVGLVMPGGV